MNEQQALESIKAVEQMWETDIIERLIWKEALAPLDNATVAAALLKLYEGSPGVPTIDQVVEASREMELERVVDQSGRPDSMPQSGRPDSKPLPIADNFAVPLDPWVKAWAVARFKHKDYRVFPQQKPGYDALQTWNPHYRDYVWPDQEQMPPEDIERYVAEAAPLKPSEIFELINEADLLPT